MFKIPFAIFSRKGPSVEVGDRVWALMRIQPSVVSGDYLFLPVEAVITEAKNGHPYWANAAREANAYLKAGHVQAYIRTEPRPDPSDPLELFMAAAIQMYAELQMMQHREQGASGVYASIGAAAEALAQLLAASQSTPTSAQSGS